MTPYLYAFGVCVVGAVLEGAFAGGGIRQRLRDLQLPRFAPPFWAWVLIGVGYYAICFAVLVRLFDRPAEDVSRNVALGLLGGVMFVNALWNYFFFRTRNLFHAFLIGVPYTVTALAFFGVLWETDRASAWCLAPYLGYLLFANVWGYQVWRMNPPSGNGRGEPGA